jgi:RNA polymerase sigma factor (TIGR02999 family)
MALPSPSIKPRMVGKCCQGFAAMTGSRANNVTAILRAAQAGDPDAAALLLPLVYDELRKLARTRMAKLPPGQTLQPTALVHEAYLRLLGKKDLQLENRRHFFFAAARAMRDILVEQARRKAGPRRGGHHQRVELDENIVAIKPPSDDVLALHEALAELEKEDPLKAEIVHLRYFAGMDIAETAQVLGISQRTLYRHWRFIKAWLASRLARSGQLEAEQAKGKGTSKTRSVSPSVAQTPTQPHSPSAVSRRR